MKKNIEDYIFLKENFLGEDFCDHSIDILSKATWEKVYNKRYIDTGEPLQEPSQKGGTQTLKHHPDFHIVGDMNMKVSEMLDSKNLTNQILQREIDKIQAEMMRNLPDVLMEYFNSFKFNWLHGWTGYSGIKFNRYSLGQEMTKHWDNIGSIFPSDPSGIPVISLIGFLNDDYEGADLILCDDIKIDTKKGNILIFPSSFMYPHQVTPLTKGFRYSYVSWAY